VFDDYRVERGRLGGEGGCVCVPFCKMILVKFGGLSFFAKFFLKLCRYMLWTRMKHPNRILINQ
jgi:hypothetical protein